MPKKTTPALEDTKRLMPPPTGAVVRMYRIGHGDCFLIAFAGDKKDEPVYVLIDCGYKPGSPAYIKTTAAEVTKNIRAATGGRIHLAIITHEHQDHVNGITQTNFKDIKIDKTWLAWTENPKDSVANQLREIYKDKLLGLIAARNQLALGGDQKRTKAVDDFLAFEFGGDGETFDPVKARAELLGASESAGGGSMNKKSMKIFKDRAAKGVKFLRPHGEIETLPGASKVRVFALGPPRNVTELQDLDPQGKEEFHGAALAMASPGNYFAAAALSAEANPGQRTDRPFPRRYQVEWNAAVTGMEQDSFFKTHYGQKGDSEIFEIDPESADERAEEGFAEIPWNPEWRRIDNDWLYSAENLALAMNNDTNNASLVLAFELEKGGKVLLFAGDAQRGNWISWSKTDWTDDGNKITAKDLLGRTVLYKVGHHCSHNATLNGQLSDDYPNLGWMAAGKYGDEFVAMITAVRKWAETQNGWNHPFKAIKDELIKKASGRVFQTDTDFNKMPSDAATKAEWAAFRARTKDDRLYFDYEIRA